MNELFSDVYTITDGNAPIDEKQWRVIIDDGVLCVKLYNDTLSAFNVVEITRVGYVPHIKI